MPFEPDPTSPPAKVSLRDDALDVVRRLRGAGHAAYFAGGCVRDLLLGREPKDFDVATDAPPTRVRSLFSNTQAVGAAFGVILVRQRTSQIEVATFRSDGKYLDGRRPEAVTFTSAEEDARRRDFTINGLFLDPLENDRVLDFVGGLADLADKQIRAIGDADKRFEEDHLRLLRAIRFAARLDFNLESSTAQAIRRHAPMLTRISPERIGEEMRSMLPPPTRLHAWRLLHELELAPVLFRFVEVGSDEPDDTRQFDSLFSHLRAGQPVPFPLALTAAAAQWLWWAAPRSFNVTELFERTTVSRLVQAIRRALKLSNEESDTLAGTLEGIAPLVAPDSPRLSTLKRFLARPAAGYSRHLLSAIAEAGLVDKRRVDALQADLSALEQTEYAPAPLLTGDHLTAAGFKPGPAFKRMLEAAYTAQLEGHVSTLDQAMAVAQENQ